MTAVDNIYSKTLWLSYLAMNKSVKYIEFSNGVKFKRIEPTSTSDIENPDNSDLIFDRSVVENTDSMILPCPFCGLPLQVYHWHEDHLENPDWYEVGHVDLKEAAEKQCFMEYVGFDSIQSAIDHANKRYNS